MLGEVKEVIILWISMIVFPFVIVFSAKRKGVDGRVTFDVEIMALLSVLMYGLLVFIELKYSVISDLNSIRYYVDAELSTLYVQITTILFYMIVFTPIVSSFLCMALSFLYGDHIGKGFIYGLLLNFGGVCMYFLEKKSEEKGSEPFNE
jgi:hypothetical protein